MKSVRAHQGAASQYMGQNRPPDHPLPRAFLSEVRGDERQLPVPRPRGLTAPAYEIIMRLNTRLNCAIFCSLCITAAASASGKPLPKFAEPGTDGKIYTEKSLSKRTPVLIMFFEAGCPHSPHGVEALNELQRSLNGKVVILGMINAGADKAKQFAKKFNASFPIIADLNGKVILKFGAQASLDNALLTSGSTVKIWNGYNQSTFKQLESMLRGSGGPSLHLDLSRIPKDRQSGCAFGMDM